MATWQERMGELMELQVRPAIEHSARGTDVDEGERVTDWEGMHPVMNRFAEDRDGRVKWSPDSRLWLIEHPDDSVPAEYAAAMQAIVRFLRRRGHYRALKKVTEVFQSLDWLPRPVTPEAMPKYEADADARDLEAIDFYAEVLAGADALVHGGWSRHEYPEREYMRRKAEAEVNWSRSQKAERGGEKSQKEAEYDRAFNRYTVRFHRQREKIMTKRREVTRKLPT